MFKERFKKPGGNMKIFFTLALVIMLMLPAVTPLFPAKLGVLPEVMKPQVLTVSGNHLFVMDGAVIYKYALPELKLLKTFGRQGEGPGELKVTPLWHNTITLLKDSLMVDGFDKIVYFSKEGKLIKERRKPTKILQLTPLPNGFLGMDQTHMEDKTQFQVLRLYDSAYKIIKELARNESPAQSEVKLTFAIPDILNYCIYDNKIFIENSREGFVIDVFDSTGKKLYQVRKDMKKIPVTTEHRVEAENIFKSDPFVREIGYENFKRNFSKVRFPKYFPPIQNIDVADNKLYVRTFRRKKGKEECLVMDLRGNILFKTFLPRVSYAPFIARLTGIKYYTIHNGRFYYLEENLEKEEWGLYVEEIKKK